MKPPKQRKKPAAQKVAEAIAPIKINELTLEIPEDMPYDENDPIAVLNRDERRYVQARILGSSQKDALRIAKPHWSASTIDGAACLWEHRHIIATAIRYIQSGFSRRLSDSLILSKEQRLSLLSQAIMTPLSDIDDSSIFCTEHKITINANGETQSYKKEPMSTLIKAMGDVEGDGLASIAALGIGALLTLMRKPGLPSAGNDAKYLDMEAAA